MASVRDAVLADVDPGLLYRILALRVNVFVVEQQCPYPELDGRDLEPDTRQLWAADADGAVLATLRLLREPDGVARIGRVATVRWARGRGLAAELIRHAIAIAPDTDIVLGAQSYLEEWYARFGFRRDGVDYVEDGIAHVPMRRRKSRQPLTRLREAEPGQPPTK